MTWWLQLPGLVLGFLGALFLTISQQPGGGIFAGRATGEVPYLVLEYPRLWGVGLWLLCLEVLRTGCFPLLLGRPPWPR